MSSRAPAAAPRRTPRLARLVGVALAVHLVGSVAGLAYLDPGRSAPPPGALGRVAPSVVEPTPRDPLAERETAVRTLLDRRAAAVLARDREAFLATVHPGATVFRERQAALFDALADVPLSSWEYELDPTRGRSRTPELDDRYGADGWWSPDVVLRYAIEGFDVEPTYAAQRLTFARTESGWAIAADDDFEDVGFPSVRGIWDGGPVVAVRGRHCLVLGHGSPELLRGIADDVDRAVPRVSAVWGTEWARGVVVLVPADQAEVTRMIGSELDLSRIAAVATAELPDVGGEYVPVGDRVIVNPPNFAKLGPLGRSVVLSHEVTHVATRRASGPDMPTWLVEGLADYVGYLDVSVDVATAAREVRVAVQDGRLPSTLPADADFAGSNARLAEAYEQSWLAVRLLVEQYGLDDVLRFYRTVGASRGQGATTALEHGFTTELGTTTAEFTAAWRNHLARLFS